MYKEVSQSWQLSGLEKERQTVGRVPVAGNLTKPATERGEQNVLVSLWPQSSIRPEDRTDKRGGNRGIFSYSAQEVVKQYDPISLGEMAGVALLNRTDTKFVMATGTLLAALSRLNNAYGVLDVSGVRLHQYQTLYFDTADFALYHRHHAGATDRYKVRSRAYVESQLSFFEVKHKTNKKRTIKNRLQTPQIQKNVNRETANFLAYHYPYEAAELLPALWNSFTRITLVSNHRPERLTLDFNLSFQRGSRRLPLPGIAIAEVKREGFSAPSDFVQQIRLLGVRQTSFSKYCLGVSYLYPQLKHNNFKSKQLLLDKLMQGEFHGYDN